MIAAGPPRGRLLALAAWLFSAAVALPVAGADAETSALPRVGDRGFARTVVDGSTIVEIPVVFLGTQENLLGPGLDLHLVRLEGPVAERVGVAAGMSGSPVWFHGELFGALAYRLGTLPTEPIAGVTPIADILDADRAATRPPGHADGVAPIATPVILSGATPRVRDWASAQLAERGFVLTAGASGPTGRSDVDEAGDALLPGAPIGVQLVRGDLSIAATGTLTWVDGDRVWAFGHPFLGTGKTDMPLVRAEVVHTLADLTGSSKLARIGGEIGSVVEDRLPAIVGRLGRRAPVVPLTVRVDGGSYGRQSFSFEVARSGPLAPLLLSVSVANALSANPGFDDETTFLATGRMALESGGELPFEFAAAGGDGGDPAIGVAAALQQVLATLWNNPFAEVRPASVELDVRVARGVRRYTVESLHYDRGPIVPGTTLEVRCRLRGYRGGDSTETLSIAIPPDLDPDTPLALAVGTATQVDRALGQPLGRRYRTARDLDGVIEVLGDLRSPNRLIGVLYRAADGVVSAGHDLTDLPPTAERLLSARGTGDGTSRLRVAELARAERELDGPLDGGLVVRLTLDGSN